MKTYNIKKINNKFYDNPIPVYCLNIPDKHEFIIVGIKGEYLTKNSINFGFLFGSSSYQFAKNTLEKEWTEQECDDYIKENNLDLNKIPSLLDNAHNYHLEANEKFCKYWLVGIHIKKLFFETYKGLELWIENNLSFAKENGYIRSSFGRIRRLPQLKHIGAEDRRKETKTLMNIALNSPVQDYEVVLMYRLIVEYNKQKKEKNLKGWVFDLIHDAIEMYVPENELVITREILKEIVHTPLPENKGIPLEIEGNIADPYSDNPTYWDLGIDWDKF